LPESSSGCVEDNDDAVAPANDDEATVGGAGVGGVGDVDRGCEVGERDLATDDELDDDVEVEVVVLEGESGACVEVDAAADGEVGALDELLLCARGDVTEAMGQL